MEHRRAGDHLLLEDIDEWHERCGRAQPAEQRRGLKLDAVPGIDLGQAFFLAC